jgi:hypothetical protein
LLGPLGAEPHVSVEAVFCDPVSDLAVLGPVDGQEHYDEARAYDELVEAHDPLPLGASTFDVRLSRPHDFADTARAITAALRLRNVREAGRVQPLNA